MSRLCRIGDGGTYDSEDVAVGEDVGDGKLVDDRETEADALVELDDE